MSGQDKWPIQGACEDRFFRVMSGEAIRRAAEEGRVLCADFDITTRCAGSCRYCYTASEDFTHTTMPKEKVFEVIDQIWDCRIRHVTWPGGDPLLHPDFFEIMEYAGKKGLHNFVVTSGLISARVAQRLADYYRRGYIHMINVHLDTISPEVYSQLHIHPRGLARKLQGLDHLLEAGFPPEQLVLIICLTRPAMASIEETMEWFIQKVGRPYWINLPLLTPQGHGKQWYQEWEPGLSDVRRAFELRTRFLGTDWDKVGPIDITKFFCQTMIYITADGNVNPCGFLQDMPVGNLYREPLSRILEEKRDQISFKFEVKGACASCERNEHCFGCRSRAHHFLGDLTASDPKCWLNPESREFCFS